MNENGQWRGQDPDRPHPDGMDPVSEAIWSQIDPASQQPAHPTVAHAETEADLDSAWLHHALAAAGSSFDMGSYARVEDLAEKRVLVKLEEVPVGDCVALKLSQPTDDGREVVVLRRVREHTGEDDLSRYWDQPWAEILGRDEHGIETVRPLRILGSSNNGVAGHGFLVPHTIKKDTNLEVISWDVTTVRRGADIGEWVQSRDGAWDRKDNPGTFKYGTVEEAAADYAASRVRKGIIPAGDPEAFDAVERETIQQYLAEEQAVIDEDGVLLWRVPVPGSENHRFLGTVLDARVMSPVRVHDAEAETVEGSVMFPIGQAPEHALSPGVTDALALREDPLYRHISPAMWDAVDELDRQGHDGLSPELVESVVSMMATTCGITSERLQQPAHKGRRGELSLHDALVGAMSGSAHDTGRIASAVRSLLVSALWQDARGYVVGWQQNAYAEHLERTGRRPLVGGVTRSEYARAVTQGFEELLRAVASPPRLPRR